MNYAGGQATLQDNLYCFQRVQLYVTNRVLTIYPENIEVDKHECKCDSHISDATNKIHMQLFII